MEKIVKIISNYEEGICPICGNNSLIYEEEDAEKRIKPWCCDTCKATGHLTYRNDTDYGPNVNVHLKDGTPVELVAPNSPDAGSLTVTVTCEEGVCPVCGGSLTYNGCKEDDDSGCTYPWVCDKCGASGKEGYTLSFDGNHYDVETAHGIPVEIAAPKIIYEKDELPWYPDDNCVPSTPAPVKAAGGWFVPVTWEMHGVVRIPFEKAATLADAFKLIKEDPDIELPKGHYVDDSFAPSFEEAQIEEVRALYNDNRPDGEVTV